MKAALLFIVSIFLSTFLNAQSLAINTDGSAANSSAMLDVKSTTKGMLIPRMTKAQKMPSLHRQRAYLYINLIWIVPVFIFTKIADGTGLPIIQKQILPIGD
ncbi:MAG: hypothetical protein IPP48_02480 [Chitinophagaceae bacterium]|nr:hypothetical protein [Chitinophagaceae bacterium]